MIGAVGARAESPDEEASDAIEDSRPSRILPRYAPRRARLSDVKLLGRHQLAAGIGTTADFATMIALVELAYFAPETATVLSALAGGLVNFVVSRRWAFAGRHTGSTSSQAARYAAVSFGGALLNAGLLAVILRSFDAFDVPYPLARAVVAIAVSLFYTYPLHARVVFRVAEGVRLA